MVTWRGRLEQSRLNYTPGTYDDRDRTTLLRILPGHEPALDALRLALTPSDRTARPRTGPQSTTENA